MDSEVPPLGRPGGSSPAVVAICINQGDDAERTHQVQLMSSIYTKCTRGLLWLGEAHSLNTTNDAKDKSSISITQPWIWPGEEIEREIGGLGNNGKISVPPEPCGDNSDIKALDLIYQLSKGPHLAAISSHLRLKGTEYSETANVNQTIRALDLLIVAFTL